MKKFFILNLTVLALLTISCGSDDDGYIAVDDQSPTIPLNLIATNITENTIHLSWDMSTDNIGVSGYLLYLDGSNIQNINETSTIVSGLLPETTYDFYVTAIDAEENESEQSNSLIIDTEESQLDITFETNLSDMELYTGLLSDLTPAEDVYLFELNSKLFTDYAHKQRLLRLPEGEAMQYNGSSLLPDFPDNTLISKTFYYYEDESNTSSNKIIIETRILIKTEGTWKLGNYKWNDDQTEAIYTENSSQVSVSYLNAEGITQDINYQIPGNDDCITCHQIFSYFR